MSNKQARAQKLTKPDELVEIVAVKLVLADGKEIELDTNKVVVLDKKTRKSLFKGVN